MKVSTASALLPALNSPYLLAQMKLPATRLTMVTLLLLFAGCGTPPTHTERVLSWRAERHESLLSGDSWLTLVGLYWLREGDNSFGSDPSGDVVLPGSDVPLVAGRFHLADSIVTIFPDAGLNVRLGGEPIDRLVLQDDHAGGPTILTLGTLSFYIIKREGALAVRVKDSASVARETFEGLDYYPIAEKWRVQARFVKHPDGGTKIAVPTFQGPTQFMESPGSLEFEIDGLTYTLDAFIETGGDDLFIVFGDQTNGRETYGGGRFMHVPLADGSGMVDLDFNRAYCPPCVFTPFATCPLPPSQNKLAIKVEAGEKNYHLELFESEAM